MRLRSDEGAELDAKYSVESDGDFLGVVLESAGGQTMVGQPSRNHEYVPALVLLLERLRARHAVLQTALVVSARVAKLPESERQLVQGPIALAGVKDIEEFRRELTSAQGRIGLPATAVKEGNNRKRIKLRVEVPGYGPADATRLADDLREPAVLSTVEEAFISLLGERFRTALTNQSPDGQRTDVDRERHALDVMTTEGSVLAQPHEPIGDRNPWSGALDRLVEVKVRREQERLRALLAGGRRSAPCALCGHPYPVELLVAAHVKKRAQCTDAERADLANVAMLACLFGCDALFEAGWITVDEHGRIRVHHETDELGDRLADLDGLRCGAHGPGSEPYFAWHREQVFRGSTVPTVGP